jgi:hypothetical protein
MNKAPRCRPPGPSEIRACFISFFLFEQLRLRHDTMDPFTAIGLASAIVQFVDFSSKLISGAAEIRSSGRETTAELQDTETVINHLKTLVARVRQPLSAANGVVPDEYSNLEKLKQGCEQVCDELQAIVQSTKVRKAGSRRAAFVSIWKAQRSKGKLASLHSRLDRYKIEIMGELLAMMSDDTSRTNTSIQGLWADQTRFAEATRDQIQRARDEIVRCVESEIQSSKLVNAKTASTSPSLIPSQALVDIQTRLDKLTSYLDSVSREDAILERLWFDQIWRRETTVDEPHARTYRWMLYDPEDDSRGRSTSNGGTAQSTSPKSIDDQDFDQDAREIADATASSSGTENDGLGSGEIEPPFGNDETSKSADSEHNTSETDSDSNDSSSHGSFTWLSAEREHLQHALEVEVVNRNEKRDHFLSWLRTRSGVFYISGKAGSGKSTMMKFVAGNRKTTQQLENWAAAENKLLILCKVYFWNSGTELQRSLQGLYRTLLFQILQQHPFIIRHVFPDAWSAITRLRNTPQHSQELRPFDIAELRDAINRLFGLFDTQVLSGYKMCLFIDGLDEYEGDYWKLAKEILAWASASTDVKFCLSSRPHGDFLNHFAKNPEQHLRLPDFTRGDMLRFVQQELRNDERYASMDVDSNNHLDFVEAIVTKASGVFLWVKLVTGQILKGIGDKCSMRQLQERLTSIPNGLDQVFRRMMDAIPDTEQGRTARMLLTMICDQESEIGGLIFTQAYLDDVADNPSLRSSVLSGNLGEFYTRIESKAICHTMGQRAMARSQGLLEVVHHGGTRFPFCHSLQFIHRTAREFVSQIDIRERLRNLAGDFHPYRALTHALLAMVHRVDMDFKRSNMICPPHLHQSRVPRQKSWRDLYRDRPGAKVVDIFFAITDLSERKGCPPFTRELESLIRMLQKQAMQRPFAVIGCKSKIFGFEADGNSNAVYGTIAAEHLESAIVSFMASQNHKPLVLDYLSSNPDVLLRSLSHPYNILLSATLSCLNGSAFGNPMTRDAGSLDALPQFARHIQELANLESRNICKLYTEGNGKNSPRVDHSALISDPPWTTWTSFLLALSQTTRSARVFEKSALETLSAIIELYLTQEADASVYFVGFMLRRSQNPQEQIWSSLDEAYCIGLRDAMSMWNIPHGPSTRERLTRNQRWSFARTILPWFATSSKSTSKIKPLKWENVGDSDLEFMAFKVVAEADLHLVRVEEIAAVLKKGSRARTEFYT